MIGNTSETSARYLVTYVRNGAGWNSAPLFVTEELEIFTNPNDGLNSDVSFRIQNTLRKYRSSGYTVALINFWKIR